MSLAFLHTAELHRATFDRLVAEAGYRGPVQQLVRPDLLARARRHGLATVAPETTALLRDLAAGHRAVVCTCSTLGPLVDQCAGDLPHVLRIDRPLMETALTFAPDILVAFCLQSTRAPTLALLTEVAQAQATPIAPRPVFCADAWPRFEADDMAGYATEIARAVGAEIAANGRPACLLLAQASMQGAAPQLQGFDLPILTSPPLVTARAIALARAQPVSVSG